MHPELSDEELDARRDALVAQRRIEDEQRFQRNENRDLLTKSVGHHLGISGTRALRYVTMLEGRTSAKGRRKAGDADAFDEAAADLSGAPVTPNEFADFCTWYRRTHLGGNEKLSIPSMPEKLVGYILGYREQQQKKTERSAAPTQFVLDETPPTAPLPPRDAAESARIRAEMAEQRRRILGGAS